MQGDLFKKPEPPPAPPPPKPEKAQTKITPEHWAMLTNEEKKDVLEVLSW